MKYVNKFLFFLITVFTFISLLSPCNVFATELNNEDLKIFLDNITKENFEKYKLPSLSMIVVKDGKVIYENSLGYEDVENKIKANINTTAYRIGSTSKLFTETAIMQLYEQGKIDLKEDANKYLKDVQIENKFTKKVTVENLLTHTSGIDEATTTYIGAKTEKDMMSLSQFFKKHTPIVVTEPGKVCLYSNIGIDLLGKIIEDVSGLRYEDYIEKNIFNPLEMKNSKVALPLNNMAKNYDVLAQSEYYYYNDNPAGGINSTASDIAKFMIAHLQKNDKKENNILNESTLELMHKEQFSNDKSLLGVTYGFWEKDFNGKRVIGHEGALAIGFFGDMLLCPEENVGVYIVSNNLTKAAPAITNIENDFFNRYYPKTEDKEYSNKKLDLNDEKRYIGTYRSYHDSAKGNFSKFLSFLGSIEENEDVKIRYDEKKNSLIYNGTSHLKESEETILIKVSDNLFKREDNNELVAFKEDDGKIQYVFFNNMPYDNFEKVTLKDNYKLNLTIFIIAVAFFIIQIIKTIILFLKSFYKKKVLCNEVKSTDSTGIISEKFRLTIFSISLLNVISLFTIIYWIISFDMYYSATWYIKIALILLILSIILSLIGSILFLVSINKEKTNIYYKISGVTSLVVIYSFLLFLYNWNLIGFKY